MGEGKGGDSKFWVGFFIGGLLGAIILFFLGTKEGRKTGKMLEEKGQDFLEDFEERLKELEEKGKDIKDQVVEQMEDKKEQVSAEAVQKLDTALAHIEALQEHGRETTADLRKKLFKNIPKK